MKTDTEIRTHGIRVLVDALGPVEAERFISLMLREPFDYAKWQRELWTDRSVESISEAAMKMRSTSPKKPRQKPGPNSTSLGVPSQTPGRRERALCMKIPLV